MEFLKGFTIEDWVITFFIAVAAFRVIALRLNWVQGAEVADDLTDILTQARDLMNGGMNASGAAQIVASQIKGVDQEDIKPLVENVKLLAVGKSFKKAGVTVSFDGDRVSVDPSGAVSKYGGKLSKWLKKVF